MPDRVVELLRKYDVPAPRYTSYPTVPAWSSAVTGDDFLSALGSLRPEDVLSLYAHLPFCESLCHFCGCTQVVTHNRARSREYVEDLRREIGLLADALPGPTRPASQLHLGGGTPNFLQPGELRDVVDALRERFRPLPDAELAIEMHPRTSTRAFCEAVAELGFNRISLGVQDFDPGVQELIRRHQTHAQTVEMVALLRDLGLRSFNFDLIYGLPGQTLETWRDTLAQVIDLDPDRLAVYSYAHVPWVRPVQRAFRDEDLPPPELKLRLFAEAYRTLLAHGYRLIGIDHFAKQQDELSRALDDGSLHRNFMGYSTRADAHQVGFGMSAISFVAGNYYQNEKTLEGYVGRVREGRPATFRGHLSSREDRIRRDVILAIMCRGRVDFGAVEARWGLRFHEAFAAELARLAPFVEDGLLELDAGGLRVEGEGLLFLRNVAMAFDPYLDEIRRAATTPTFSRAV